MKKLIFVFTVLFFLSSVSISQNKKTIMLNAGFSIPVSPEDFSDYWSASYNLGGNFGIYLTPQMAIVGFIEYNNFSLDHSKFQTEFGLRNHHSSGGSVNIWNISANIKYHPADAAQKVSPYILGGLGYYRLSISDLTGGERRTDNYFSISSEPVSALSINFGIGAEFSVSRNISVFAEARYVFAFTNESILKYNNPDNIAIGKLEKEGTYIFKSDTKFIPIIVGVCYYLQ